MGTLGSMICRESWRLPNHKANARKPLKLIVNLWQDDAKCMCLSTKRFKLAFLPWLYIWGITFWIKCSSFTWHTSHDTNGCLLIRMRSFLRLGMNLSKASYLSSTTCFFQHLGECLPVLVTGNDPLVIGLNGYSVLNACRITVPFGCNILASYSTIFNVLANVDMIAWIGAFWCWSPVMIHLW